MLLAIFSISTVNLYWFQQVKGNTVKIFKLILLNYYSMNLYQKTLLNIFIQGILDKVIRKTIIII